MTGESRRLDVWLWHARFFRTRSLASAACKGGAVRINGRSGSKPSSPVRPGDVLAFPQGPHIRVVEIKALAERRGPAPEAQALYADLSPPQPRASSETPAPGVRDRGAGRPTKRERRALDRLRPDAGG